MGIASGRRLGQYLPLIHAPESVEAAAQVCICCGVYNRGPMGSGFQWWQVRGKEEQEGAGDDAATIRMFLQQIAKVLKGC